MEKALLVKLQTDKDKGDLSELEALAYSAGAKTVAKIIQHRKTPEAATFIGSGKVEELRDIIEEKKDIDLVIFDHELSLSQVRNIERIVGVKVIDRTQLVLDIFAQRARSNEAKLQVELAQLRYLLPRLKGKGLLLSQLGGGIGTRGPGETKLEYDRRRILSRINTLEKKLDKVSAQRSLQRKARKNIPLVAIIGYTNSGKSTLFNALTKKNELCGDKLFLTLDTKIKKIYLNNGFYALLSDTVGFIERLPVGLIKAFLSTLEEIKFASLLLHVIDVSLCNSEIKRRIKAVNKVLEDLSVDSYPKILVLNKIDKLDSKPLLNFLSKIDDFLFCSAKYKIGIEELRKKIGDILQMSQCKNVN